EPEIFSKKDTLKGLAKLSGISNGRGIASEINLTTTWADNWAIKTRGGYKKLGDLSAPDYGLMNTGMESNSFGFTLQNNTFWQGISLDYYLTQQKIGIFRGSDLGNLNDFYDAITSQKPIYTRDFSYDIQNPMQNIQHHIAKLSAFKRYENWGKISLDYSFQYNKRKEYDVRRGDLYNIPAMQLELYTNQLNITDFLEREKWSLETGIQGQYQYNYSPTSTQAKRLIPNYNQYNIGAFSVYKYNLSQQWKAELGIRYDYQKYLVKAWFDTKEWEEKYQQDFSQFYILTEGNRVFTKPELDYNLLGYNFGINYNLDNKQIIRLNFSNTNRTPNIAELFAGGLHHSAAMIEQGDMRLTTENTSQIQLDWESNFMILKGLKININPYYYNIKGYISQIPTGIQNTIRGVFPVWSYQQVDAKIYGLDLDSNWKINNFLQYKSHFSFVHGNDITNNQPLIMMMPTQWTNAIEINLPWKKSYFKIENIWVAKQNRYPNYNPTIMIYENGIEVEKTLDLSTPPPAYQLWNLQGEMEIFKQFTAGVTITNLFDISYKNYLNRLRYFSNEMGRNIIFSLQYKF
ncbi:MAG: TonB-dependent receptor, partial [Bacteroidetes bacterium]|nr:TonB-dependent receptor [Bacteroidota bacterium]